MHGDNEPPSPREGERSGINSDSSTSPTHGSQVVAFVAGQELVHKGGEVEQLRLEKKRLQRELRRERELHLRNVKCMSDMFEATVQVCGCLLSNISLLLVLAYCVLIVAQGESLHLLCTT